MSVRRAWTMVASLAMLGVAACTDTITVEEPTEYRTEQTERIRDQYGTVHGEEGLFLAGRGSGEGDNAAGAAPAIGVNVYLWRASLDTVDFMPLVQADPFGGVIITDWYAPPETPSERFKLTVFIRDRVLRADGVKVSVFRQVDDARGWVDAAVDPNTSTDIENGILTRARELRIAALGTEE
jgi:hypothetical protein